jgi:two-component system, NtrC family, sensor kinase
VNLFDDLVPQASQRGPLLRELSESDSLRNHEATLRRKDGSMLEALLHVTAVREPQGTLVQYRGLILDITDQKVSRAALRRERDFNQGILNHTQSIILVLDASGCIGYVNHRAAEVGYSAEALLGLPLARLIHTSHRPVFQEALRTVLDSGAVQRLDLPFLRRDGSVARFVVHLSSMREERGDSTSAVVVMTDVTEASLLQAKLAHTEKMAALGQLVSGVAHEVNNPLSAIVGFTDLLLENPDLPEFAREELGVIQQEAERTRLIVQNMLRFAREMPPQREPVQINLVLRQTLELRSYGLANRNVEIVERLAENLPVVVADPHQLEQVFLNVLNNAFDAIEQVGRRGRIEVETKFRSENIEIYFRDNGPGISNPDRIFEPFFTTKPVGKGTGLGLSICYGIIHAHMGEIVCQNNAGAEGCTFLIRLPAATIHTQAASADAGT